MWINPHYAAGRAESFAIIARHPLATVVAGPPLHATHMPVLLDGAGGDASLVGHVPRADPISLPLTSGAPVLAVFTGPRAYISPGWYRTEGRLPTYDFVAVHVTGTGEPLGEDDDLRAHLLGLIAAFERTQRHLGGPAWEPGAQAGERIERLLPRVVGFRIRIDAIQGKVKVGQEGSAADARAVAEALAASPDTGDRSIATLIAETRAGRDGRRVNPAAASPSAHTPARR